MSFVPLLAGLLAAALAAGCAKANDLPHLKDEAMALKAHYDERVGDLAQRSQQVALRFSTLPRDVADAASAQKAFMQGRSALERVRTALRQLPSKVQSATKPDELHKLVDGLHDDFELALREANTQISAVESWVAIAERRRSSPPAPVARAQPSDDSPADSRQ